MSISFCCEGAIKEAGTCLASKIFKAGEGWLKEERDEQLSPVSGIQPGSKP